MLPTLSHMSVRNEPGGRLRRRCSSRYQRISTLHLEFHHPLSPSSLMVSDAVPELSPGLSHPTFQTACVRFTPSNSEQRLHPPYYRGCWHGVSRCFLVGYRQNSSPTTGLYNPKAFSPTRHGWIRVAPIVQYSPLLPPVGVWAVSQSQCGWSSSQTSYPSLPWWAVTPPTS